MFSSSLAVWTSGCKPVKDFKKPRKKRLPTGPVHRTAEDFRGIFSAAFKAETPHWLSRLLFHCFLHSCSCRSRSHGPLPFLSAVFVSKRDQNQVPNWLCQEKKQKKQNKNPPTIAKSLEFIWPFSFENLSTTNIPHPIKIILILNPFFMTEP